jgi:hypothetical protein
MKKWRTLNWSVVIGERLSANFGLGFDGFFPRSLGRGEEDLFEVGLARGQAVQDEFTLITE